MLNYKQLEQIVIQDVKPKLVIKYLLLNELQLHANVESSIPKEVIWLIIEYQFKSLEEIIILYQDINIIHYSNIIMLKFMSGMIKEDLDFVKHGLCPIIDSQSYKIVLHILKMMYAQEPFNLVVKDSVINMSKELAIFINTQWNLYNIKYSDILNHACEMVIKQLKTDKKYIDML